MIKFCLGKIAKIQAETDENGFPICETGNAGVSHFDQSNRSAIYSNWYYIDCIDSIESLIPRLFNGSPETAQCVLSDNHGNGYINVLNN